MVSQPVRSLTDCGRVFPSGVRVGGTVCGLGVFAYAFIPQGTPIGRVPGKMITDPNYGSDYCINAGEDKVLEPAPPFCYLNHSCEPNCLLTQYVREGEELDGEELEEGNLESQDLEEPDEYDEPEEDEDDDECFFGEGGAEAVEDVENVEDKVEENGGVKDCAVVDSVEKLGSNSVSISKEVELEVEPEFEDDVDSEIWVEALRDILPGEQLTIDYAWPAEKAIKCQCGCKNCRGWIIAADELELLNAK
jgi:hypothetical protein